MKTIKAGRRLQKAPSTFFMLGLLLACSMLPLRAMAMPMLSSDGSLLTGVVVGDKVYEVTFGDGVIGDFYPLSVVEQPGWFDLVDGIKDGIVEAFTALGVTVDTNIRGCDDGTLFGTRACIPLIPDTVTIRDTSGLPVLIDSNSVLVGTVLGNGGPTTASRLRLSAASPWLLTDDTAVDGPTQGRAKSVTLARFRLTSNSVPVPGSLGLLALSLLLLQRRIYGKRGQIDHPLV